MKPLCVTCKHAQITRGVRQDQVKIFCNEVYFPVNQVPWPITECTSYLDARQPSLEEMEAAAWILRSDAPTKRIVGFVSPDKRKEEECL